MFDDILQILHSGSYMYHQTNAYTIIRLLTIQWDMHIILYYSAFTKILSTGSVVSSLFIKLTSGSSYNYTGAAITSGSPFFLLKLYSSINVSLKPQSH